MAIHNPVTVFVEDSSGNSVSATSTNPLPTEGQAGSLWSYGNWPDYATETVVGTPGASNGDTIILTTDSTLYNEHIIASTVGAITVTVSIDGTNFSAGVQMQNIDPSGTSLAYVDAVALAVGLYKLTGKFKAIKIVRADAGNASTATMISYVN